MPVERVLEIRTYRIREGECDEFGRRMRAVLPMLERHGIDVVGLGPSIEDDEHFVLLRSFASLDELVEQEQAFYEGDEWRAGPREGVLELIETYHTVVLRRPARLFERWRSYSGSVGRATIRRIRLRSA